MKRAMEPAEEVDVSAVGYKPQVVKGISLPLKVRPFFWPYSEEWLLFSPCFSSDPPLPPFCARPRLAAPHLAGFFLRVFVWLVEAPVLGSFFLSVLKRQNGITKVRHHSWSAAE